MTRTNLLVAAVALLGLGCSPEAVIGKDSDGAGSEAGSETTSDATGGSGTDGGATGTGSSGGLTCPPHEPMDACQTCVLEGCCPEVQACDASPTCLCIETCLADGHSVDACKTDCGDDGTYDTKHQCQFDQCDAAC